MKHYLGSDLYSASFQCYLPRLLTPLTTVAYATIVEIHLGLVQRMLRTELAIQMLKLFLRFAMGSGHFHTYHRR